MAFKKPKDYDDVKVFDYKILPAGGYVCKILKAEETTSSTGKPMLKVAFDIIEGEYENFFRDMYEGFRSAAENPGEVKWPFNGTKWILFYDDKGGTSRNFKAFCTAVEESGTEVWRNGIFDTEGLKGARVGVIFRREEHEYMNERSWRTTPLGFRSTGTIIDGNFNIPADKPLPEKEDYLTDSFEQLDVDLPFA